MISGGGDDVVGGVEGFLQSPGVSGRGRRRSGSGVVKARKLVSAGPAAVDVVDRDDLF